MKITKKWLRKKDACIDGYDWFCNQKETDSIKLIKKLMEEDHFDYANWLIVNVMKYKQYVSYGVFAAELALPIYEAQHPDNSVLREAIEAAKKCIEEPSKRNKQKAYDAYAAAYAAAENAYSCFAARAAFAAARVASAAYDASYYTTAASDAASAVSAAAYRGASSAAEVTSSRKKIQQKIIKYGIKLLEEE